MIGLSIYLYMTNPQKVPDAFAASGALSLLLLVIVFLCMLNFEFFFSVLHKPFFEPGSYVFSSDSLIIQVFPLEFFRDASANLARMVFVNSALFLGLGLILRKFLRNKKSESLKQNQLNT